jgi:hypothetical protein
MNDQRQQAEALDAFLNAYHEGEHVRPQTPEARLAADLVDLAASLNITEPMAQAQPPANPSTTSPSFNRLKEKEDRLMIAKRHYTAQSMSLPLVAALLLFLLVGVLVFPSITLPSLVPLASSSNVVPPVQDQPRLPIPVGGVLSGIDPTMLDQMRSAGMEWAAFQLEYRESDHNAILETARTRIERAHEQGFRAWITLSSGRNTEPSEAFSPEADFDQYAELVGKIAALGADAIQVWAEPNLSVSWPDQQLEPSNYVELLRLSSEAIKAANPETLVISAAPAPTGAQAAFGSEQIWNDDLFYQAMASFGAADYADCIGVNYLEGVLDPVSSEGDPRDNYPTRYFVPMIQRAAAAFRESRLPLCLTEYGYLAGEGELLPDGFEWAVTTTVEQQAEWLAQGIQTAAQLSSVRVQMAIIYRIDQTGDPVEDGYAIVREDGSCPACDTIAALKQ